MKRHLVYSAPARPVTDGDGVKIHRNVASKALETFDPFLLLDEIFSEQPEDYIGGFPEHPHRGFETVTYMLEGSMKHRDHMGNEGLLQSGGVQWMTAGRGVIHSEMPMQNEGRLHGFQLWINLPARQKMQKPDYQEYACNDIPVITLSDNSRVKVIAGCFDDGATVVQGPVKNVSTAPDYFDITLADTESLTIPLAHNKTVLLYVYQGAVEIEGRVLPRQNLGMLSEGESVTLTSRANSRVLFLAGTPLREPVANWGPFVMNTREEIEQAIADYRNGTLV